MYIVMKCNITVNAFVYNSLANDMAMLLNILPVEVMLYNCYISYCIITIVTCIDSSFHNFIVNSELLYLC